MAPFANELRSLMDVDSASSGKAWLLSAAPQCPFPDVADDDMLNDAVFFDAIWVQFYNNYCGLQSFIYDTSSQSDFNFETWDNWARTTSKNLDVRVLLGIPGNANAAGSGYVDPTGLASIVQYCSKFSSFGGVMAWDASQADNNLRFLTGLRQSLTSSKG